MKEIQGQTYEYLDEYRILKLLGSGLNAKVFLGQDQNNNLVAIKKYKEQTSTLQDLIHQLTIMQQFNHQNIIQLLSVRKDAIYKDQITNYKCFAIILEYIDGGQLFDFVAQTGNFSEKVARTYFHQLIKGLHYIHGKGYAHRDIKPQNLLISNSFILKIADFGFSCSLKGREGNGILTTRLGTRGYMAPQIYEKKYDGKRCDIFAAGVILFIMYAGCPPFQNASSSDPYYKLLRQKDYQYFWAAHSRKRSSTFFTQPFKYLFQKLVAFDPTQRLTISQIASNSWVNQTICTVNQIYLQFSKRKVILDKKLQLKKIQIKKQSQQKVNSISSQGFSDRGQQDTPQEYLQQYNKQYCHPRPLKPLPPLQQPLLSTYTITTKNNIPLTICNLKQYLTSKTYPLIQQQPQSYSQSQSQQQQQQQQWLDGLDLIKLNSIQDNHTNQIMVTYQYSFQVKQETYIQLIKVIIKLGLNAKHQFVLRFELMEGCDIYFKKIFYDIKKQCFGAGINS